MDFDCGAFFKAVADPNRVKIMLLLCGKELSVTELCRHFRMKQPSISHHLGILKNARIVESRKEGREVYYKLNECCVTSCCADFVGRFTGKRAKAEG